MESSGSGDPFREHVLRRGGTRTVLEAYLDFRG